VLYSKHHGWCNIESNVALVVSSNVQVNIIMLTELLACYRFAYYQYISKYDMKVHASTDTVVYACLT
jgi:hypothetical protein